MLKPSGQTFLAIRACKPKGLLQLEEVPKLGGHEAKQLSGRSRP